MPHITFVYPCIGRFPDTKYIKTWQMQPLSIAVLSALTPDNWQKMLFDDRMEDVDYDQQTDLAAISIETFNAKRGYQIAAEFRKRGIPVVMGGFHATFCPDEAAEHATAVCVGPAEDIWNKILEDAVSGTLNGIYKSDFKAPLTVMTDRNIFADKKYLDIDLVETGRGCRFKCDFCSISSFYNATYQRRPVDEIISELKQLNGKVIFFVDDNIVADFAAVKELFKAMIPLKIRWVSQATINIVKDKELLELMVASGCVGVLIGFESLDPRNLCLMSKSVNDIDKYSDALATLRKNGIRIYGTFVFGYQYDTKELMDQTEKFAVKQKMFLAAFNHLIPFPGTPLYNSIKKEKQLKYDKWWLNDQYRFGQMPFEPLGELACKDVQECCLELRRRFYSFGSIIKRGWDFKSNSNCFEAFKIYTLFNILLRNEVDQKVGLPLGLVNEESSSEC